MALKLVLTVPDLQAARMLTAAGVPQIALSATNPYFVEIKSWLEGTQVGASISEADQSIPPADFLVVPIEFYENYSFVEKKIYWVTSEGQITDKHGNIELLPYAHENENFPSWLDFKKHEEIIAGLFD